jgi:hypothetical protein
MEYTEEKQCPGAIANKIRSYEFWGLLDELIDLLGPIDEAIRMSESGKSNLSKVVERWLDIRSQLSKVSSRYMQFKVEVTHFLANIMPYRQQKQLTDLHWAAFILDPTHSDHPLDGEQEDRIIKLIQRFSPTDPKAAIRDFANWRGRTGSFYKSLAWEIQSDASSFWSLQVIMRISNSISILELILDVGASLRIL